MKKYRVSLAASTLITAAPALLGNKLLWWLPLVMAVMHVITMVVVLKANEKVEQNEKLLKVIFWMMPVISWFTSIFLFLYSNGYEVSSAFYVSVLMGGLFIILGNYMPKAKQNTFVGIRVVWALENEENWNRTHRFGGKVYVLAGLAMLAAGFLPVIARAVIMGIVLVVLIPLPILYSYLYYRKQKTEGSYDKEVDREKGIMSSTKMGLVITVAVLVVVGALLVSGDVKVEMKDTTVSIGATYYSSREIAFEEITSLEYRENYGAGSRIAGFGSFKLSLGEYRNEEFDRYVSYFYNECESAIILKTNDHVYILNQETPEETLKLYEQLEGKVK